MKRLCTAVLLAEWRARHDDAGGDARAGAIPHPRGEIAVKLARSGAGLNAEASLPAGVEGEFVWAGRRHPLKAGTNTMVF